MKLLREIEPSILKEMDKKGSNNFYSLQIIIFSMLLCLLVLSLYDACLVATWRKEIYIEKYL